MDAQEDGFWRIALARRLRCMYGTRSALVVLLGDTNGARRTR